MPEHVLSEDTIRSWTAEAVDTLNEREYGRGFDPYRSRNERKILSLADEVLRSRQQMAHLAALVESKKGTGPVLFGGTQTDGVIVVSEIEKALSRRFVSPDAEPLTLSGAVAVMVFTNPDDHGFEYDLDGDGWTEPFSDHYTCTCDRWSLDWCQADPECSDRPDPAQMLVSWARHVTEDLTDHDRDNEDA